MRRGAPRARRFSWKSRIDGLHFRAVSVDGASAESHWTRFKRADVRADDLLQHFQIIRPPVPVDTIVRRLGIPVVELDAPGWSGAADSTPEGRATIFVRRGDAPWRKRFTIAHELGHLLLHGAGRAYRDDTFRGTPEETQANEFAANLLMPFWMLEGVTPRHGRDAHRLARVFGVSEQAMDIRLGRLIGL